MAPRKKSATKRPAKARVLKKVANKKSVLPRKVKKILDNKNKLSDIVMFEHSMEDDFKDISVSVPNKGVVNVDVIEHPLDQYSSPHLLDLSEERYIERVKPTVDNSFSQLNYSDLPAGELLEKLHVFELLAIENSEILNWCKKVWFKLRLAIKRPFQSVDLSPKLPLAGKKKVNYNKFDTWGEVSLLNLLFFIGDKVVVVLSGFWQLGEYFYVTLIGQYLSKDEIVMFESKEIAHDDSKEKDKEEEEAVYGNEDIRESGREVIPLGENNGIIQPRFSFSKIFKQFEVKQMSLRPLLAFFVVALLLAVPIRSFFYIQSAQDTKGEVLGQTETALDNLKMAQAALIDFNFEAAEKYLVTANKDFVSAKAQLDEIKSFLTVLAETLPFSNTYRSGKNLLDLGDKLTKAGEHMVAGINQLSADSDFSLASRAKNFRADILEAMIELESAQENLNKIKINHLPEENREQFIKLKENLPIFMESLDKSNKVVEFAINFLGEGDLKKYLIIFQNDNELRATGGFMGSYALVDFKNGDIAGIKMPGGGTYDVRAGFKELLQAPQPLQLINPRWEFQDSNWWPDWPTSARNISYFYNKSDGATLDGVIAINSDWLGTLLEVVGPIDLPDYQKTITAANFETELQKSVEIEYEDKKAPKKILGDMAPQLIERIFDIEPSNVAGLIAAFKKGLDEKDITIYLSNETDHQFVADSNWDGRIKDTEKDYLNVVITNIGGGKTDGNISQEIYHKADIASDGSIIDTVLISRSHFGPTDEVFTNRPNRSYIRVYVPRGSELITAKGFKRPSEEEFNTIEVDYFLNEDPRLINERVALIDRETLTKTYNEGNKTVFGNWLTIDPGETQDILLVYKLPFKLNLEKPEAEKRGFFGRFRAALAPQHVYDSYSMLVQKQSGSEDSKFIGKVNYPAGFGPQIAYPKNVDISATEGVYEDKLSQDLFYFIGLKQ